MKETLATSSDGAALPSRTGASVGSTISILDSPIEAQVNQIPIRTKTAVPLLVCSVTYLPMAQCRASFYPPRRPIIRSQRFRWRAIRWIW